MKSLPRTNPRRRAVFPIARTLITAILGLALQACSFAMLPGTPRPSPSAQPRCPRALPLLDAGLGVVSMAGLIAYGKEVQEGKWRDVPRGLMVSAVIATVMIGAFGSAAYGARANSVCERHEENVAEQRELRERRLEAWELLKRSADDCSVLRVMAPGIERLDPELYAAAIQAARSRCAVPAPPAPPAPPPPPVASPPPAPPLVSE